MDTKREIMWLWDIYYEGFFDRLYIHCMTTAEKDDVVAELPCETSGPFRNAIKLQQITYNSFMFFSQHCNSWNVFFWNLLQQVALQYY